MWARSSAFVCSNRFVVLFSGEAEAVVSTNESTADVCIMS